MAPLHVVVAAPPRRAVACALCRAATIAAAVAASYSILARTAATDTHALSFLGLEASALWEGELSLVRVCSCFSTMHIDYVEVLALAACLVLVSLPACLHCLVAGCLACEAC